MQCSAVQCNGAQARAVQHVEHSQSWLEGVTAGQLLAFIWLSGYCAALSLDPRLGSPVEEPAARQEVAAGLAVRGMSGACSRDVLPVQGPAVGGVQGGAGGAGGGRGRCHFQR